MKEIIPEQCKMGWKNERKEGKKEEKMEERNQLEASRIARPSRT